MGSTKRFPFAIARLSAALALITFLIYSPCLKNDFTNWDDEAFVTKNLAIRDLSIDGIVRIFNQSIMGSYQPLTVLSFAFEYNAVKLNPQIYHATNILLHATNTALVFILINLLCRNIKIAFLTAVFFSIHPLRVESVAWISQRKDCLYALFYLASCITYVSYLKNLKNARLAVAFIFFLLACLSKVQAATLPLVLFLLDYFHARRFSMKLVVEKLPFFALSAFILFINWSATHPIVLVERGFQGYNALDKFFLTNFAIVFYLLKFIVPYPLSALYPYPEKINGLLPLFIYLTPLVLLGLVGLLVMAARNNRRLIVFGTLFFVVTLALPMTNIWMSQYLTSDRYTYIPSIGIFFIVFSLFETKKYKKDLLVGIIAVACIFSLLTYNRCAVWRNSVTLWNDVIAQYPQIPNAYLNRGVAFTDENLYDLAMGDYNRAIAIDPNYRNAFYQRGRLFHLLKKYDLALHDLDKTTHLDPNDDVAYVEKGVVYKNLKQYARALENYSRAIELNPTFSGAFNNRGVIYVTLNQMGAALSDFNEAIRLSPLDYSSYVNRGNLYLMLKKPHLARADYDKAMDIEPKNALAYIQKARIEFIEKNYTQALLLLTSAAQKDPTNGEIFYARSLTHKALKNDVAAREDALKAQALGFRPAASFQ